MASRENVTVFPNGQLVLSDSPLHAEIRTDPPADLVEVTGGSYARQNVTYSTVDGPVPTYTLPSLEDIWADDDD